MNARTRTRQGLVGAGVAALLVPLGLALTIVSADAAPVKTHNLQVYKKQASIILEASDPDAEFDGPAVANRKKFTVSCKSGDFAVDGTWTVDKVDDWNDDEGHHVAGDESLVYVTESVGRNGMGVDERNIWDFSMTNTSPSRAQVTAYVVCLADTTKGGSNPDHALEISDRIQDGTKTFLAGEKDIVPVGTACAPGQISVANGWSNYHDFTTTPQIRESWPLPNTSARQWQLTFRSVGGPSTVTQFHRCLTLKTLGATNHGAVRAHAHNLYASFDVAEVVQFIDKAEDVVVTRDCTANNAAYVSSAFSLEEAADNASYLGVAPRHRTSAWHFAATANHTKVFVGGTCLQLKTGKQVATP